MGKAIGPTLFAVIAAVGGFFLRSWELATIYDETGLPLAVTQVPASITLIGFSLLVTVLLAFLCRGGSCRFKGYSEAFAVHNPLYLVGIVAAAGCIFGSALFAVMEFSQALQLHEASVLGLILAGLSAASAMCLIVTGVRNYRGNHTAQYSAALLVPAFTSCLWLVDAFRRRSADPLIIEYVYMIFAIGSIMLALYFITSFSFDRFKVYPTAFFSLLAIYFTGVTLADGQDMPYLLLLVGFALYLMFSVVVLLMNNTQMPKRLMNQQTKQAPDDQNSAVKLDTEVPSDE